jgi:hypothetical protein
MKNKNEIIKHRKLESQLEIKQYTHDEILQMSNIYYKSNMLPSHLKTPEAAYVAMMWCTGLNLHPFLGLRDIFVIDNIPSLRTEAALALVEASGFSENIEQFFTGKPYEDDFTATCIVHRKGRKPHTSTFSVKDAKDAHLWGKKTKTGQDTSWITYKKRMLMYRAVGFALRDIYPDVLRGAVLYEELKDFTQYEIVSDTSNDESVNVVIEKKSSYKSGSEKVRDIMSEDPPED